MLIFWLLATLALLPTYFAGREWYTWYQLHYYGAVTPAQVDYHWVGRLGMFDHYYVIYQFGGDTFQYSRYTEVDRETYQTLLAGEALMVRYSTRNPAVFRLQAQAFERAQQTFSAAFAWSVALFFGYVLVSSN